MSMDDTLDNNRMRYNVTYAGNTKVGCEITAYGGHSLACAIFLQPASSIKPSNKVVKISNSY